MVFVAATNGNGQDSLNDSSIGLTIDIEKTESQGIRKLSGKHLTLFTDLPSNAEVDSLPAVFDQATGHWKAYFETQSQSEFHAVGFLIKDIERFKKAGVIPNGLPPFKNGYTFGKRSFWMFEQPSHYMRRQLLIHEGTHTFVFSQLGQNLPAWLSEGLAEWFACHRWSENKLTTCVTIQDRKDAPFWGRTKILKDAFAKGTSLTIAEIQALENKSFLNVESYAWAWGICAFLAEHPNFKARFKKLSQSIGQQNKEQDFQSLFKRDLLAMEIDWAAFLADIDYQISSAQTSIEFKKAKAKNDTVVEILADRSWQNSGISVDKGDTIWIRSKGTFVIRKSTDSAKTAWNCEPNGVTIEYYRGHPLGTLMATVLNSEQPALVNFRRPIKIGLSGKFKASQSGTVFLRVNESPSGLKDNQGTFLVSIEKVNE